MQMQEKLQTTQPVNKVFQNQLKELYIHCTRIHSLYDLLVNPNPKGQWHLFLFLCDWPCSRHSIHIPVKISLAVLKPGHYLGKLQMKTQLHLKPSAFAWVKHPVTPASGVKVAEVRIQILFLRG